MNKYLHINTKTLEEHGVSDFKSLWDIVKKDYKGLSYDVTTEFNVSEKSADDKKVFDVIFSTADTDRHGDIVVQDFDLKSFKKNPVILDSHNYNSIEHIIGRAKGVKVVDGKLKGQIEFATMNPKGALAEKMAEAGFINATSIGFIPLDFSEDGKIVKSELLEVSAVSVPANPKALFEKIVEETKEEIVALEKEVTEDTPVEKIVETTLVINKKKVLLNSIRNTLNSMEAKNLAESKRKVLNALRSL
jgi:HK97 family phage prohead protease